MYLYTHTHIHVHTHTPSHTHTCTHTHTHTHTTTSQGNDHEKVNTILQQWKGIVNLKCDSTGDTALIAAARNGHKKVCFSIQLCSTNLIIKFLNN